MTRWPGRAWCAGCLVAAVLAVSACTGAPDRHPSASTPPASAAPSATSTPSATADPLAPARPAGQPEVVASELTAPWSVVPLASGGALVSQRDDGTVVEVLADGSTGAAGTVPGVVSGGESGLHGLALHVDGSNTWLYAYHGAADDNRVVRMLLLGAPGAHSLGEAQPVLTGIPRNRTHDGGRIAFGPDGFLYVATGDAQNRPAAQDPASLGGKILRLTPDGDPAPGNPGGTAVFSLGHRNVQGIAWTPDGTMWASEFGQDTFDELNRIVPGGNYGWPEVEGVGGDPRFIDPVVTWTTDVASPSGIAAVGGTVFVTGLRGERLWGVDVAAPDAPFVAMDGAGRLRDAVALPDGSLWLLTNNTDGRGSPGPDDDLLLRLPLAG